MKKEELFDIIGEADEEKVALAGKETNENKFPNNKKYIQLAIAACLCLVAITAVAVGVGRNSRQKPNVLQTDGSALQQSGNFTSQETGEIETISGSEETISATGEETISAIGEKTSRRQGETTTAKHKVTVPAAESETLPPWAKPPYPATTTAATTFNEYYTELYWENRTTPGKYRAFTLENREYVYPFSLREERGTKRKGTKIVSGKTIEGYEPNGTKHTTTADIFTLEGFDKNLALGIKFKESNKIYTYVNTSYSPKTLGEFLKAVDYDNSVTYGGITLYQGQSFPVNSSNAKDIKKYLLSDTNAKNDQNTKPEGLPVTITITCDELGTYSKALYIYENGHIATNLIGYRYVFFVGKDNVNNFLKNSYNITFDEIKKMEMADLKSSIADNSGTTVTSKPHSPAETVTEATTTATTNRSKP